MRILLVKKRDDVLLDFSMVLAITALSVGHVNVRLK